jgi:hypothetical protein
MIAPITIMKIELNTYEQVFTALFVLHLTQFFIAYMKETLLYILERYVSEKNAPYILRLVSLILCMITLKLCYAATYGVGFW